MAFALEFRSPHASGLYETQALKGLANFCVKIFGLILVVLQVRLVSILDFVPIFACEYRGFSILLAESEP